jgi:hypothetical protein
MLGELIGEGSGKVIGQRVLPPDSQGTKMEVSFQQTGKILGVEISETGTYWSVMRQGGALYGEGQGIEMTKDGEVVTWTGNGLGRPNGRGGISYRGAIYYQTTSSKLARLNTVAAVFEFDVDEAGNAKAKVWEWK